MNRPAVRLDSDGPGPEPLGEILGRLFVARGWGRKSERLRLEAAWAEAIGPKLFPQTRIATLRRGVLEIEVASAILLQELTQFHKRTLLTKLRAALDGVPLTDLRFKAGVFAGQ